MLLALLLGPGVLVNMTFKEYWGRPRPHQVEEFGGSREFRPPVIPCFDCRSGHSFVSGHASMGFILFAVALVYRRRRWIWIAGGAGSAIGLARVAMGGHFLSDVVFSGWTVWFASLFLLARL